MSDSFNNSRGRFRRISGYDRKPQSIITIVENNVSNSYNQNAFVAHRDFYLVQVANKGAGGSQGSSSQTYASYDEDYIIFYGTTEATKIFNITFGSIPALVLEIEHLDAYNDTENIIPVVTALSTGSFTVGLSSEFSGSIRYRAIYSANYPAIVTRGAIEPALSYSAVSVVTMSLSGSMTSFTASFPALGGSPAAIYYSIYDNFSFNDCSLSVDSGSYSGDNLPVDLSDASIGATITFMAVI